jgi:glycolate dehydrogenase FAD-binding subunit
VTAVPKRSPTSADAILGVVPSAVYEPRSVEEAVDAVRESASEGNALSFVGGGTDLGWGPPPSRLDAVLRTGNLQRIIDYAPSDQVVVVEAGITLSALQKTLAGHGQQLAIDPPLPERATLGGIVAANAFGPRRAGYGSVRDLLIGVSFVRADGTLARGGGKVVKNVAGFDLPKLLTGSLGTLGLIVTATFRLHPLPEDSATVLVSDLDGPGVRALGSKIRAAQLEPTSVVALATHGGRFEAAVLFEGFRAGVREQCQRFVSLLRADHPCEISDAVSAQVFWDRHDVVRREGTLRAKMAALPTAIERIGRDVLPSLLSPFENAGFVWYASLGLGFLCGSPQDAGRVASEIARARAILAEGGGSLTLAAAPPEIRERVDVWAAPPQSLSLMKRVKERLDPERRFNPGRFVGGI